MSKSLGNVIEPRQLVAAFGLDQVRYFLLREEPSGGDGTLSHQALITLHECGTGKRPWESGAKGLCR